MIIYTIGFTKKSAERFFDLLKEHKVRRIIDIRLNNSSQLAGFSKGNDLNYFLKAILNIDYQHNPDLAPTQEILDGYKKKQISWNEYEKEFLNLIKDRNPSVLNELDTLDSSCLLCSEEKPDQCHRRLVAEYMKYNSDKQIEIIHL